MKWRIHKIAAEEYLQACEYYANIRSELGLSFVSRFELSISDIVKRPQAWPEIESGIRRHLMSRFPYGVYFSIEDDYILILAVLHMSRTPGAWRGR